MNKKIDKNYCGPRSITPEEKERLIKGKYTKFEEGDYDAFLKLFTDCPKPEKRYHKTF